MDNWILLELAIIFFSAKLLGLIAQRLHMPQVVGEIIAGLLIGPSVLGWVGQSDFLSELAEIGVILLMFFAGLETNIKDLLRSGVKSFVIACCGVAIPLACGFLLYSGYYGFSPVGDAEFFSALFIGVIMTATSVSITVAALSEMGKLKTQVGTTIMGAAIIDDVIGMIVLTFVIGMKNPDGDPMAVIGKTILFILISIFGGFGIYHFFKYMDTRWSGKRRIAVFSIAFCFLMAFVADYFFGIADITGAYVAGIILCSIDDSEYVAYKIEVNSYMIFSPIFFASIGIKTVISDMTPSLLVFSLLFVLVAMVSKIVGCGLAGKALGFNNNDSLKIGVGMMTRGEVALIVAQKALAVDALSSEYFTAVILMIITTSIVTPILLKMLYKKDYTAV